ncbi:DUF2000 domain-containing protein, partial [Pseudomonas sp. MOB-449]|nr:DUF2000 domain-containing protein [Pseudomonas sp. MOB-449]
EGLVGPDLLSLDGVTYPGVIRAPLPVLLGEGNTLLSLFNAAQSDPQILVLPFNALAIPVRPEILLGTVDAAHAAVAVNAVPAQQCLNNLILK